MTRPTLGPLHCDREELVARSGAVFGMMAAGKLKLRIEHIYPLAEAHRPTGIWKEEKRRGNCC